MSSIVTVEGDCLEAPGLALPIGALTGLAQVQKPGGSGG
jgi:hypothetical protein